VDLKGVFFLTQAVVRDALARGRPLSVVNVSSVHSVAGVAGAGPYDAAKSGVVGLTRALAVELAPRRVRVNAVSPGLIRTPLSTALLADPSFVERRLQATPLRRPGEPDEVAGAVVFLASRAGGFVTGHNLVVDGGTLVSDGS